MRPSTGNKDTYIVGVAVEIFPELHQVNLLPEGVQREDAGTGGGGAEGGAEQRETAKRAGVALYNLTRNGQRKLLKSQKRESRAALAVSTAVTDAVFSVMTDVVMPALMDARARTEEAASKSAVLSLALEQRQAHQAWSDELKEEEALGEDGNSFRKGWLQKKISELEATM